MNLPKVAEEVLRAFRAAFDHAVADRKRSLDDEEASQALMRFLRAAWHRGHVEHWLRSLHFALKQAKVSHAAVAKALHVSQAAVSGWFHGVKGVEPYNLTLLERHFGERIAAMSATSLTARDQAGFCRSVTECQARMTGRATAMLTEKQFWVLWHLHREPHWIRAVRAGNPERLALTASRHRLPVNGSLRGMGQQPFERLWFVVA